MSETNKLDFYGNTESDKSYEIDLEIRNAKGEPTGTRKSFKTDDPVKLWEFWMRNQGRPKKKRKKHSKDKGIGIRKKKEFLPTAKEANKIMNTMYTDTDDQKGK